MKHEHTTLFSRWHPDTQPPLSPSDSGCVLDQPAVRLEARDLQFQIGEKEILRGVSFKLAPGELVGIIGPNGAGKSTALAAISGDLELTGGSVHLGGDSLDALSIREQARRRAVLPQSHETGFAYMVADVILMGRHPWPEDRELDAALLEWAMKAVDIAHLRDRVVTTLSGGELARVHMARVLAQRTGLLLLDEPTAALDIAHQEEILALAWQLTRLPEQQRGVLAVLHDLSLAAAWCDRLLLLKDGSLVAEGSPWQVCQEELLSEVYGWPLRVREDPDSGAPVVTPARARR